ncbi:hypothetical protein BDV97DRAFT_359388 [Delphinella strobiligena]|nr:hypothetical protein BDV97DRAFT_359388 [Delphinella strobiligena]
MLIVLGRPLCWYAPLNIRHSLAMITVSASQHLVTVTRAAFWVCLLCGCTCRHIEPRNSLAKNRGLCSRIRELLFPMGLGALKPGP